MSSAHLCVRNVLTQAFRLPSSRFTASCTTVPDFLVPALSRNPRRRPFSSAKRRRTSNSASQATSHETVPGNLQQPSYSHLQKPRPAPIVSKIPCPPQDDRGDIEPWLAAIDPFLPPHLRRSIPNEPDISSSLTPLDLALFVNAAQDASLDVLGYIGLVERRWMTLAWISKKLAENGKPTTTVPIHLGRLHDHVRSKFGTPTLDEMTEKPIFVERRPPSAVSTSTLDILTSAPDTINPVHRAVKRAIGQLWRAMGEMVLVAAESSSHEDETIMASVLEIIAHFHHIGLVPDSVYTQKTNQDSAALQQPPTLPLLSTQILTALSDASWRAHEASVKAATEHSKATYFLGHEIPGSRYKLKVTGLGPELWLELILWSCVHGGWISDASAILHRLMSSDRKRAWGLISWRELLHAREEEAEKTLSERTLGWGQFKLRQDNTAQPEDRARTRMTVSSEIVTAVVDGLVNSVRLGVGARGIAPESLVTQIMNLKHFLDSNHLSLGSTTWDAILSRLLESGGIVPDRRPELFLDIVKLASAFGKEVSSINAYSKEGTVEIEPPYFFEPTTVPLNLFHRALRSFSARGDILGAMKALQILQQFTDSNKRKSLEQFFQTLKNTPIQNIDSYSHEVPPIEFPAFHPQVPPHVLAKLLDVVTESKRYDVGRYLLFSDDLDGPLIHPRMYMHNNWLVGASIIRFGTMAGENELVLKIVERSGLDESESAKQRMPHELMTALLCSQIKLNRWKSVQSMQEHVLANPGYKVQSEILATFGAELVRSAYDPEEEEPIANSSVCHAFTDFLFRWEHLILSDLANELYCILAILSSVSTEWKEYCGQFLAFSTRQHIRLRTDDFNRILHGIVDSHGSLVGKAIVEMWCHVSPKEFGTYRAPGGLPGLSVYREGKSEEIQNRPHHIEIVQDSGATLVLTGRVRPNHHTVRTIIQKVHQEQEEEEERRKHGGILASDPRQQAKTLKWSARLLHYLGADRQDIAHELGGLAELGGLEAALAPTVEELDVKIGEDASNQEA